MWLGSGFIIFLNEKLFGDKLPEFCLDYVLHCNLGKPALGAHASKRNHNLVTFDVNEFDVAAVGPQRGSDLLVYSLLYQSHHLNQW